jgi:hypothetical protein
LVASIDEVGRQVRGALDRLPFQGVAGALDNLDAATATVQETVAGSNDSEAAALVDSFQRAANLTRDVQELLHLVQSKMQAYLDRLGGAGSSPSTGQTGDSGTSPPSQPRPGKRLAPEDVAELADTLPPPVPKPNPEGKKTHGVWVDGDGKRHRVVSGRDEDATEAWKLLQAQGIPIRAPAARTSDVEQKLAARMVRERRMSAEVVINNVPCEGPYGCDTLVPIILPSGYTLTVHGPNYKKTFQGGATPWWR